jgi:hypothetical protein
LPCNRMTRFIEFSISKTSEEAFVMVVQYMAGVQVLESNFR